MSSQLILECNFILSRVAWLLDPLDAAAERDRWNFILSNTRNRNVLAVLAAYVFSSPTDNNKPKLWLGEAER